MRKSNRSIKVSTLAIGIVAALTATQAMASGFQIREDSIQAMSRSHAGAASSPGDAAVVANNPAAMTMFDKTTVQSDLTAIDLSGNFTGGGTDAFGAPLTGGNGGDAGDIAPVPAFHFILPTGNGWTLGASFTAPFGLKTGDPGVDAGDHRVHQVGCLHLSRLCLPELGHVSRPSFRQWLGSFIMAAHIDAYSIDIEIPQLICDVWIARQPWCNNYAHLRYRYAGYCVRARHLPDGLH